MANPNVISARRPKKSPGQESILLSRWLAEFHRDKLQWTQARLGPAIDYKEARMFSVVQRRADAIVLDDGKVLIIEAKLKPTPTALGQLEFYKELFPQTPAFSELADRPIELIFLTTFVDLALAKYAQDRGIKYETFPLPSL